MKITKKANKIIIDNCQDFDIEQTLECGQVFRYKKADIGYIVYSLDHKAHIYCHNGQTIIDCDNEKYFENYFDFQTNYATIKSVLRSNELVASAINYGQGIRILRQDPLEVIISFIISANNNIPRIKKIIESICRDYGQCMGDYYAFPTLQSLKTITQDYFAKIGAGYRAKYLYQTIQMLDDDFIAKLSNMDTKSAKQKLMQLMGVGGKVADCILLFGYYHMDVFPCDTWIKKVYYDHIDNTSSLSAERISAKFVDMFGNYSGYAQQYLYYFKRSKQI